MLRVRLRSPLRPSCFRCETAVNFLLNHLKVDMNILVSPSSPQINQGCVPRITGAWECALNSARTTATVPAVTSAAPTVVVISAPRRTEVRAAARTLSRSSKRAGSLVFLSPAVKPGRCGAPKGTVMCAEFCSHDGDCPGEQKCCRTTCGHACSEPC